MPNLTVVDAGLAYWYTHGPFADTVARLATYRSMAQLSALGTASEFGD